MLQRGNHDFSDRCDAEAIKGADQSVSALVNYAAIAGHTLSPK